MTISDPWLLSDVVTAPERRAAFIASGVWNGVTLAEQLRGHAQRRPESVAVVDQLGARVKTYAELDADSDAVARLLAANGVGPGRAVAVQLPNCYEAVAADLGVLKLGCVLNPMLPMYRYNELKQMLGVARTQAIFSPTSYRKYDHREMLERLQSEAQHLVFIAQLAPGQGDLDELIAPYRTGQALPPPRADAVSEIIFTSGTESAPKAVMHTEQTLNFAIRNTRASVPFGDAEVVWVPSPVGHSTGLNWGIRLAVYYGFKLVLQDIWNPSEAAALVESQRCTYTLSATTFLADLIAAAAAERREVTSMKYFCCGGATVPPEVVRDADRLGIHVLRLFGQSETFGVSWVRPNTPFELKVNTDGQVMEHVEVEIHDPDGNRLPDGEAGEAWVRSPSTAVGYCQDPERTGRTFLPGGWVRTGDVCVLSPDGFLTVVGRTKEIIIRGGMNIAPRELEDVIQTHPSVHAVAVIGVPDPRLGEIGCACVQTDPGQSLDMGTLQKFLDGHGIAKYKWPERLELVSEFPVTGSGKIQKHLLKEMILGGAPSRLIGREREPSWL